MNQEFGDFLSRFNFKKELRGYMGIERERFLATPNGKVAPRAKEFLEKIDDPLWTYELSACQVEDRTRPRFGTPGVWCELFRNDIKGVRVARKMGLRIVSLEVGPDDMPLNVYPEERYQKIVTSISHEQLKAACRVAGIHVHIGMKDMQDAIYAYNVLRVELDSLCKLGDNSDGERLRLYKTMAKIWEPPLIESENHFFEIARDQEFHTKPRSCYWLIRISIHGTIELRMFGTTRSRMRIVSYANYICGILKSAEFFGKISSSYIPDIGIWR